MTKAAHFGDCGAIFVTQKLLDAEKCNFSWLIALAYMNFTEKSKLTKVAHFGDCGTLYITQGAITRRKIKHFAADILVVSVLTGMCLGGENDALGRM